MSAPASLEERIAALRPDPWRVGVGFGVDIARANDALFRGEPQARHDALFAWLHAHQICMFARRAVSGQAMDLCLIDERDVQRGDAHVRARIHRARRVWKRRSFAGQSAGFLAILVDPRIAAAVPDAATLRLARWFGELCVGRDPGVDAVCLDRVYLQSPAHPDVALCWEAPLNYFCSQGDKRWWHERRIPGGMGFSINSVGHMVASGQLGRGARGARLAVSYASRTIERAGESGRRAAALAMESDGKAYRADYHTDYALPRCLFSDAVERPAGLASHRLVLTTEFEHTPQFESGALRLGDGDNQWSQAACRAASGVMLVPASACAEFLDVDPTDDDPTG